jgi:hypothetical protein
LTLLDGFTVRSQELEAAKEATSISHNAVNILCNSNFGVRDDQVSHLHSFEWRGLVGE